MVEMFILLLPSLWREEMERTGWTGAERRRDSRGHCWPGATAPAHGRARAVRQGDGTFFFHTLFSLVPLGNNSLGNRKQLPKIHLSADALQA